MAANIKHGDRAPWLQLLLKDKGNIYQATVPQEIAKNPEAADKILIINELELRLEYII